MTTLKLFRKTGVALARIRSIHVRVVLILTIGLLIGFADRSLAEQRLYANQFLFNGQSIVDPYCRFRLTLRDGILRMYEYG